jgi:hypothetical protein
MVTLQEVCRSIKKNLHPGYKWKGKCAVSLRIILKELDDEQIAQVI